MQATADLIGKREKMGEGRQGKTQSTIGDFFLEKGRRKKNLERTNIETDEKRTFLRETTLFR